MAAGWEHVEDPALAKLFDDNGLGSYAEKILEVTGATSLDDLKLIDANMIEEIIRQADLKIIPAKKLKDALASFKIQEGDAESVVFSPPSRAEGAKVAAGDPGPAMADAPEAAAAPPTPEEVVVICIDRSGSMGTPFREAAAWADAGDHVEQLKRTRMEAVKQMFYAFRDRTESSRRHHMLGLVQFDDKVETLLKPTSALDGFERIVDNVEKRGQTAIYGAVLHAAELLAPYVGTTLRIVCLTDGQSNTGVTASQALAEVRRLSIVVDAIIVGDRPDENLRRIVAATGGQVWQIGDTTEGFELLEAEGVVSLAARGGPGKTDDRALEQMEAQAVQTASQAKRHRPVMAVGKVSDVDRVAKEASAAPARGQSAFMKRIVKELKSVADGDTAVWMHSPEGIHIFPSDDIAVWRCLIEGPKGSPFEAGVFPLTVRIPTDYPFRAPSVRFDTPVYHCNISESGQPCLDILADSWNPSLSVPKALEALRSLLAKPDPNNALRAWVAEITLAYENTNGSDSRYADEAKNETAKHSSKSVDEWKAAWGI